MQFVRSGVSKILSVLGLVAFAVIGVALLGAGLIVGLAFLGLVAVAYAASKLFFRGGSVRALKIASCQECGRITDKSVCSCGTRIRWV